MKKLEYKNSRTSNTKKKKNDVKQDINKKTNNVKNNVNNVRKPKSKKRKIVVLLIVILVLLIVGISLLLTLPYFNATNFEIEGTGRYSKEELVEKADLKLGENIFIQFFKGVSGNITKLPYIDSASIKIKFPNKLSIKVVERQSCYLAFDKEKNAFYKIDKSGYILEEGTIESKTPTELLVYGFVFDNEVVFGTRLKDIDISKLASYDNIKKEYEKSGINGAITKVNFENSLTTITLDDKLNVIFPNDTDIKYKMSFFKSILAKIGDDSVGVIDMTKENPVFSSF